MRLHPATELVLLGCALLLVYGVPSPLIPAAVLLCATAGAGVSPRVRFRRWLLTLVVLAGPMLVMVGIIQGLFYPGEQAEVLAEFGPAAVTVEGLALAIQLWLRVAAMVAVCALFAFGSDPSRAFDGLLRLRVPLSLAYVCAAAMSLIPLAQHQVRAALAARSARGWDTGRLPVRVRLLTGVLTGLLVSAITQLDQRHDALAQRGFGEAPRPTPAQHYPGGAVQRGLRWGAVVGSGLLVGASLAGLLPLPSATDLLGVLDA
ncbi:energy-coupling factor transporter transmembrane component T family protein [Nesterenkonia jeotgali]|uniref:Cobalt transporter n=1 Tax=Nesterenkonia jeotgali TaxID=317018 RepID=A0A0W8IC56_9MICC|nr:energy-coupling factor transporter transmembrane component T [Nesterenkonia jeotgali]KUG57534.1 cobalt transporter [Nesterenkonia jeotgali]MBA8922360.1 energy-coupling factor transport system permease protein [Nesterenkonia jeotgali]